MTDAPVATAKKILERMTDLEFQTPEKTFTGLFYGGKGVGKTTMVMGLAQKLRKISGGMILFLDSGDGWVSLERFPALKRNTRYVRVDDPRELMVIARAVRTGAPGYEDISVVVMDEESSWWTDTLHSFAREMANVDEDAELPVIDWTWYGPPQQAMFNVIKNFFKTPGLHLIITAHEQGRGLKNEKGGPDRFTPTLGTKLSERIGEISHVVGRMEARKVNKDYIREVQVLPTRYVDAKSRVPSLELKEDAVVMVQKIADWVAAGGPGDPGPETVPQSEPHDDDGDEDFEVSDETEEG